MNVKKVYEIFSQLNAIPRASHHEEKVADFLCQYAEHLGLDYDRDSQNCVVIRKAASQGYEAAETIVLLNHMDMVAVGDGSREFNPLTDSIEAYTDNGWMKARGTSLGADNGIGLSMALAVLADDSIPHPALEVLTTTNEEDGMSGAANLSPDFIKGRKVINLDSEDYDTITVGAAGAYLQTATFPVYSIPSPEGLTFYKIGIEGGLGGHSGVDINKGRMNAICEVCRWIYNCRNLPDFKESDDKLLISSINGGNASASIPSSCMALIGLSNDVKEIFESEIKHEFEILKNSLPGETNVRLILEETDPQVSVIDNESISEIILGIPQGVIRMHPDIPGTVMTSNNIGVIRTDGNEVFISCHTRSFDDKEMVDTATAIREHLQRYEGSVSIVMNTPGWQEKQDSDYLGLVAKTFNEVLGFTPRPVAMHFVLEAGYYVQKYPGIQIACIGPRIIEPHSTKERVELKTIDDIYDVTVELLKRLK